MLKRRTKLILPRMQLRLTARFAGMAFLAMLLQFLGFGYLMIRAAQRIPGSGGEVADQVPMALVTVMGISIVVLLPLFFFIGVQLTFRYAGPVYRFEQYLGAMARGEEMGPCKIREGDEMWDLCHAINAATAPLQKEQLAPKPVDAEDKSESEGGDSELRKSA